MLTRRAVTCTLRARGLGSICEKRNKSSISDLQAAFRNPSSPFHLPPGTQGPASPDTPLNEPLEPTTAHWQAPETIEEAREKLIKIKLDPQSFWEQKIVWGDHDAFQHVNNVRYFRFFENARIKWMMSVGEEIGGPRKAKAMMNGQGVSLILKSMDVHFRRPVTFPDTLLVGYRPTTCESDFDGSTFQVTASAYSLQQKAFVAHSKEFLVWYDYDKLKKSDPGDKVKKIIRCRMGPQ